MACRRVLSSAPLKLIGSRLLVAFGKITSEIKSKIGEAILATGRGCSLGCEMSENPHFIGNQLR
jgi:hypothetical protein